MVGVALLLVTFEIVASKVDDAAEHKNQVVTNSGSEPSNKLHENGVSSAEPEHSGSGEEDAKEDRAVVHSVDSGETKSANISGLGSADNAEATKKKAADIDPNAVLMVEIKISKNNRKNKSGMSQPKSNSSKLGAYSKAAAETEKSRTEVHKQREGSSQNSGGLAKATQNTRDTGMSSVSYQNGRSVGSGYPANKQAIEAVLPEQCRPAPAIQTISAVLSHPTANGDPKHLENFEGGLSVLCIISKNINLIKERIRRTDSIRRVRSVLVLRYEDGDMWDYWERLRFKEAGGTYVDETGFYEGKVASSTGEVLESGKLTKNGFYQSKDLPDEEVEKDFLTTMFLLSAIARERGASVNQMASENCDISLVDKLLFASRYAYRPVPKKEIVCICADCLCKKPCKDIKQIDS